MADPPYPTLERVHTAKAKAICDWNCGLRSPEYRQKHNSAKDTDREVLQAIRDRFAKLWNIERTLI